MAGVGDDLLKQAQVAHRAPGANSRLLLSVLLCAIGFTAITGVVVAAAVGQSTVAVIIGLVSAAFFAGIMS